MTKYTPIFENLPALNDLSADEQFRLIQNDPAFQQHYLSGDALAVLDFNEITKRYTDHKQAEQAEELAKAKSAHEIFVKQNGQPVKSEPTPQQQLDAMTRDPEFRKLYESGDGAARQKFDDLTRQVAGEAA